MKINFEDVFIIKNDSYNLSIRSIMIDLDEYNLSYDKIIEISKKYEDVFLVSDNDRTIGKYRINLRFIKNIKLVFKSRISLDIKKFIDVLFTSVKNLEIDFLKFIESTKEFNMIFLNDIYKIDGFINLYDNFLLRVKEKCIIKNIDNKSSKNIEFKIKSLKPTLNKFKKIKIKNNIPEYDFVIENKNKNVIYTCITRNYENLYRLTNVDTNNFDYICFTDNDMLKLESPWNIININDFCPVLGLSRNRFSKFVKYNPHILLKNYEKSIWIDGNVDIVDNIIPFMNLLKEDQYILLNENGFYKNIFDYFSFCYRTNKDDFLLLNKLNKKFIMDEYSLNNSLVQTNVIVRNHNDQRCISVMNEIWKMICDFTYEDQLLFNYAFWKYGGSYLSIPWEISSLNYFYCSFKHGGNK